ncbi:hypothetical protein [Deinococcus peraridilitoris]|uniref:Uncharacterized protein n=1 Tax=Deinococcus peraridilitoris (strain DSM 19664 / LMG 22246 / CIP 109416 / KR-200) TaxID=937777 RepID=L0A272_DEIPD|nr:hypothetical protein [Deinococcus peraridilitoris]AFZ67544.1 hypothetical protein Deipe_2048 [Deinococcus peraridilitoris DSM 19664]
MTHFLLTRGSSNHLFPATLHSAHSIMRVTGMDGREVGALISLALKGETPELFGWTLQLYAIARVGGQS